MKAPASAQAAYRMGAACPFDSTNRSLFGFFGFLGSNLMTEKNRVATMSAAERQLVGCPLPAAVVARTLRIRKRVASFLRLVTSSAVVGKGILLPCEVGSNSS